MGTITEKNSSWAIIYNITTSFVVDGEEVERQYSIILSTDYLNIFDLTLYLNIKYRIWQTIVGEDWFEETIKKINVDYIDD